MNVLFLDNIDSFTYNVVHLLAAAGACVDVARNDDPRVSAARLDGYGALVVGPGPGRPASNPATLMLLAAAAERGVPALGVCLGHQAIGQAFGGSVIHAPVLMHGKVSRIAHDGTGLFSGLPSGFAAARYHSLCIDPGSLPACLRVVARSADGVIQGVAHRSLPIHGVQFHPESVMTEHGLDVARNFLRIALARNFETSATPAP